MARPKMKKILMYYVFRCNKAVWMRNAIVCTKEVEFKCFIFKKHLMFIGCLIYQALDPIHKLL